MPRAARTAAAGLATATFFGLGAPMLLFAGGGSASCGTGWDAPLQTSGPRDGKVVGATTFGGPSDPSTPGDNGAGGSLNGRSSFAELSRNWRAASDWDFSALGGLPMGTRLRITANGRSVVAEKRDVGRGGPPVGSPPTTRVIDLWWETAKALGLPPNWSGRVLVQRTGDALPEVAGEATCASGLSAARGSAIVRIARAELGTREPAAWRRYGPDPWCALFVSWVWQQAGIDVPTLAFTGALHAWAKNGGGEVLGPTAAPQPGDAVLYGTGPQSPGTSVHVGLVEQVFDGGQITTIEGNTAGGVAVARIGPFAPAHATQSPAHRPGPIYAYVRPRKAK